MNEFKNIEELNQTFQTGRFQLPDEMFISGLRYRLSRAKSHTLPEMLKQGKKDFVVYIIDPAERKSEAWKRMLQVSVGERPLKEWIVLIWALDGTLSIRPARAVTNTEARARGDMHAADKSLSEAMNNVVSDTVPVKFTQFNKEVPGKVDTGANLSSLHCEEWKVDSGKNIVEFRSSLLSNNSLRVSLIEQVGIQTAEGSEYRPVIALNISINGKDLQNTKFNLNDRSHMQDKLLIGQNILEQGKFLVDPNKEQNAFENVEVDWEALQEMYKDIDLLSEATYFNEQENFSIGDLLDFLRSLEK